MNSKFIVLAILASKRITGLGSQGMLLTRDKQPPFWLCVSYASPRVSIYSNSVCING